MLATSYSVLCDVLLIVTKLCLIIHVIHMFLSIYNRASVLSPCNQEIGLKIKFSKGTEPFNFGFINEFLDENVGQQISKRTHRLLDLCWLWWLWFHL